MTVYFSGIPFLEEIMSPERNREYGLLENLQLLLILGSVGISIYALFKKTAALPKWMYVASAFLFFIIFLEEMDYGAHFKEYFTGKRNTVFSETFGVENFHNRGNNNTISRLTAYLLLCILFAVLPFMPRQKLPSFIVRMIPPPRMIILAGIFVFSYWVPRALVHKGIFEAGNLGTNNIGEFTELTIYYCILAYLITITFPPSLRQADAPIPASKVSASV